MRFWTVLVLVSLITRAQADDRAAAKEHFQKGSTAFALGAYDEAIAEYSAAYRAKDDPALLYNIAQAHRLAGHAADALRFYKMYLTLLPRAPNREEVEAKIAELQRLAEQQKKTQQQMPPDEVKPPTQPEVVAKPAEPASTPPHASEPLPPVPPPSVGAGRTKKIAGLAVAGVGVAALVCGIALGVVAKQYSDEVSLRYDTGKESTGNTLGVVGPTLMGVGGAAVLAGVVVAALGFREGSARHASITPWLGTSIAGVALAVSF